MSESWVPLDVEDVDPDPFVQFERWFEESRAHVAEPEAVCVASATRDGRPSARMVLLRHHDGASFGWYTNYESRKGRELLANPFAALLWYCEPLGRQIRIEGAVAKMDDAASDAYFVQRPRGSQIGAHASRQGTPLADRDELEWLVAEVATRYEGRPVPRPDFWGGFLLTPDRFEFWQHRESRLHDRVVYLPEGSAWRRERQSP